VTGLGSDVVDRLSESSIVRRAAKQLRTAIVENTLAIEAREIIALWSRRVFDRTKHSECRCERLRSMNELQSRSNCSIWWMVLSGRQELNSNGDASMEVHIRAGPGNSRSNQRSATWSPATGRDDPRGFPRDFLESRQNSGRPICWLRADLRKKPTKYLPTRSPLQLQLLRSCRISHVMESADLYLNGRPSAWNEKNFGCGCPS